MIRRTDRRVLSLSALVLAPAYAPAVLAQSPAPAIPFTQSQGMFAGTPLGAQVQKVADLALPGVPRLEVRTAGIESGRLERWTSEQFGAAGVDHPDYSTEALYGHWITSLLSLPPNAWDDALPYFVPVLGGMSSGGDITPPVDWQGNMVLASAGLGWYALSFTVGNDAIGLPGTSIPLAGEAPGGWVFDYTVEGSSGIRSAFVETVRVEYTRDQNQLEGIGADAEQITALDWGMGVISTTPGQGPSIFQPERNSFYFTFDADWVQTYYPGPTVWTFDGLTGSDGVPTQLQLDTGTVYAMEWDGTEWSLPMVAFDHWALYGAPQTNVAIDALSVYRTDEDPIDLPARVVFSLDASSTIDGFYVDQILVSQRNGGSGGAGAVTAETLKTYSGTEMSLKSGLEPGSGPTIGPDDIKGLCGRDPFQSYTSEIPTLAPFTFDQYQGTPIGWDKQVDNFGPLGCSTTVNMTGKNKTMGDLVMAVTGIDLKGNDFGVVQFELGYFGGTVEELKQTWDPHYISPFVFVQPGEVAKEFTLPKYFLHDERSARVRARVHGVNTTTLNVQLNIGVSWTSVLK